MQSRRRPRLHGLAHPRAPKSSGPISPCNSGGANPWPAGGIYSLSFYSFAARWGNERFASRCPPNYPSPKMVMTTLGRRFERPRPARGQNPRANRPFSGRGCHCRCGKAARLARRCRCGVPCGSWLLVVPVVAIGLPYAVGPGSRGPGRHRRRGSQVDRARGAVSQETARPPKGNLARTAELWRRCHAAVHVGTAQLRLRAGRRGGAQSASLTCAAFSRPPPTPARCRRWCFAPPSRSGT